MLAWHKRPRTSVDNPPPARPILNQLIQAAHGLAHRLWRLVLAHHMQQRLHQATLHRAVHDVGAPCEQRGQEPAHVCHTHAVLTFVQEVEVQVQVLQLLLHLLQQHRPALRVERGAAVAACTRPEHNSVAMPSPVIHSHTCAMVSTALIHSHTCTMVSTALVHTPHCVVEAPERIR
eukprot:366390-Chlamydomonas_euryale.AAC.19